jgi:peptidyl-prolyl cis-trans isomerase A (cyclophilin A)
MTSAARICTGGVQRGIGALLTCALIAAACATFRSGTRLPHVLLKTEKGDIELEIDTIRAPVTGANFLRYVDGGYYNRGLFHRTVRADNQPNDSVRIAVIQASADTARRRQGFPAIALERTSVTGIRHVDGCVSMARNGPDTATSSFFICVGAQPSLDFGGMRNPDAQGFAAFGRVVAGMDVVKAIHAAPVQVQTLSPPIRILSAARVMR